MTWAGDCLVRTCTSLHNLPAAVMCILLSALQMGVLDYYLVSLLSLHHLGWLAADFFTLILLVLSIAQAHHILQGHRHQAATNIHSLAWASWLIMSIFVCAKVSVLIVYCIEHIEEEADTFWGPNTLKTTIALGSCTFLLLLITQHDAVLGSESRHYIDELTGTVVFDILDTVEILDILLDAEKSSFLWDGLDKTILGVAVVNLLLPAVPLFTLSRTQFGRRKLHKRLIYLHRILVVLVVNVPNLAVRMLLWHGHSMGISPFTLKNIVLIAMTTYEFYEHKKMKYRMHEQEKVESMTRSETEHQKDNKESEHSALCGSFNDRVESGSTYADGSIPSWSLQPSMCGQSSQRAAFHLIKDHNEFIKEHTENQLYGIDFSIETRVASL